ncbi:hypothetical protein FOA52_013517 [Chlamydomonas sp. UWO 241]|nr:hypothetical protein FOA52_013517 [Chlamydomonas sp. UWO 241]
MSAATAAFNACSGQVIAVERALADEQGRADLARLLRRVQEGEREKLRLTLVLQALRSPHAIGAFSWQRVGDGEDGEDVDPLDPPAPPRWCGCGNRAAADAPGHEGHGHGAAAPPEPTKAEWAAALREAQLELDGRVRGINDALEDVRYVLEDEEQE